MIDKNNNFVIKSKLTITVKTLSEYNDRSRVAAKQTNKQTNRLRHRNWQTFRQKNKKLYLHRRIGRLTSGDMHKERKNKWKMRPYAVAIEISK